MRIRIKSLPSTGTLEEFDLRRFRIGETYDVTAQFASMLIILGHAEPVSGFGQEDTAADSGFPGSPRPKG